MSQLKRLELFYEILRHLYSEWYNNKDNFSNLHSFLSSQEKLKELVNKNLVYREFSEELRVGCLMYLDEMLLDISLEFLLVTYDIRPMVLEYFYYMRNHFRHVHRQIRESV